MYLVDVLVVVVVVLVGRCLAWEGGGGGGLGTTMMPPPLSCRWALINITLDTDGVNRNWTPHQKLSH